MASFGGARRAQLKIHSSYSAMDKPRRIFAQENRKARRDQPSPAVTGRRSGGKSRRPRSFQLGEHSSSEGAYAPRDATRRRTGTINNVSPHGRPSVATLVLTTSPRRNHQSNKDKGMRERAKNIGPPRR